VTYSIVARDPETGELGVAVQTKNFAVGAVVPCVRPGVGAVATQAFTNPANGPLGLELLAAGKKPDEALAGLLASDVHAAFRQVGIVDAEGRAAAHTGERCVPDAGHVTGEGWSAQANMMRSADVWPAMAEAFPAATGPLAERLLTTLEAAEQAGGDFRGRQSAAVLVMEPEPRGAPWKAVVANLRVDDHPEPLVELRRLVERGLAIRRLRLAATEDDLDALAAAARAVGVDEDEIVWDVAAMTLRRGDRERAQDLLGPLLRKDARWQAALDAVEAALALESQ
jgi:uncharacterized Ntn-hydrolase superfamily protein